MVQDSVSSFCNKKSRLRAARRSFHGGCWIPFLEFFFLSFAFSRMF